MVELEESLVPRLSNYIKLWKQYVDDTITFAKIEAMITFYLFSIAFIQTYGSRAKQNIFKITILRCVIMSQR